MKATLTLFLFVLIGTGSTIFSQTVTIGTQVWMTKNLDVATFRNGDPIPEAKTKEEWTKAGQNKQPAWCYYDNDPANGAKYGKLYNWFAVNDPRGLAPIGYHVPTDPEWTKLTDFLGGIGVAGAKMKSKSGWNSYTSGGSKTCPKCANWNAEYRRKVPCHTCQDTRSVSAPKVTNSGTGTNTSGFTGLPGGGRTGSGAFGGQGNDGWWWSASEGNADDAYLRGLDKHDNYLFGSNYDEEEGCSVRCLRD
jgi:hypothetical protein